LIQDLLEVASLEAGRFKLERQPFSARPFVEEALEAARAQAAHKELRLDVEFPQGDRFDFDGDRDRALQVLGNLLGNAVKFTEAHGRIVVRVEPLEREVQVSVSDTGPGISADDLSHVFDRFWQAQKTARMGTGLGLSIARGMVEAHGGRIWVNSQVGVGSTFHFTLPLGRPRAREVLAPEAASEPAPSTRLVLVAEDDIDVREVLVETLEAFGYRVLAARNGAEALEVLETTKPLPELILLDLLMPVMDGWEFLAARSRAPAWEAIPVIVLSGERDVEQRLTFARASYIPKPVPIERLVKKMEAEVAVAS
jgi:CheY-like chemotaxis protein